MVESGQSCCICRKTGRLISTDPVLRLETIQWVFFQMATFIPCLGSLVISSSMHRTSVPIRILLNDTQRNQGYCNLESHLQDRTRLVGEAYSIGDTAIFPWVNTLATFYAGGY